MSFELQKSYIERDFESFTADYKSDDPIDLLFTYYTLGNLFPELDPNNIDPEIITDWGEDKQIDAVYLVPERNELNIIQVKKSNANFSSNVIIQLANWLNWFLSQSEEKILKLNNIRLKDKILEVRNSQDFKMDKTMIINVYYCNLWNSKRLGKEVEDELEKITTEIKPIYPQFNFRIIWVNEYYDNLKRLENDKIDADINITDKNAKLEYDIDENTKWLVVTVDTNEIAKLVEKFWNKLFEQNIRYSLWVKNPVNKEIRETAVNDDSKFFWYFNNGITIVCNTFSLINNPNKNTVSLKNLQIVNGCQTSTTLYDAYLNWELKDSYVIVKIFSSNDDKFINTITKATNSQSSINSRDLFANDEIQELIRENLYPNYFYEHKRNQYKWKRISESKKINNEKLWQAVFSILLNSPSKARSKKWLIFSSDYYEKIYKRPIEELVLSYKIFSYCEQKRKEIDLDETNISQLITYWGFHLSRIMGNFLFKDRNPQNLKDIICQIEDSNFLESYYQKALKILEVIVNENEKEFGKVISFTNFFKLANTEELINKYISAHFPNK